MLHCDNLIIEKTPEALRRKMKQRLIREPVDPHRQSDHNIGRKFANADAELPALIELPVEFSDRFSKAGENCSGPVDPELDSNNLLPI